MAIIELNTDLGTDLSLVPVDSLESALSFLGQKCRFRVILDGSDGVTIRQGTQLSASKISPPPPDGP